MKLAVFCGVLSVVLLSTAATLPRDRREPKPFPAYCIDPWTSQDLGMVTYAPCAEWKQWKA